MGLRTARGRGAMTGESNRGEVRAALEAAARERILILDGAMGTQIQGLGFGEDDFRGAWRLRCALASAAGQQRPADPHPAARRSRTSTTATPSPAPTSSRPTPSPRRRSPRPTTAWRRRSMTLNRDGARARPACLRPGRQPRTASGASSPARSGRPTARRRSRRTSTIPATAPCRFDDLRHRLWRAAARADRRRRRPDPDRDDLRHAERQGGDLRLRGDLRREGRATCR